MVAGPAYAQTSADKPTMKEKVEFTDLSPIEQRQATEVIYRGE
jgi:hypothetical protein